MGKEQRESLASSKLGFGIFSLGFFLAHQWLAIQGLLLILGAFDAIGIWKALEVDGGWIMAECTLATGVGLLRYYVLA